MGNRFSLLFLLFQHRSILQATASFRACLSAAVWGHPWAIVGISASSGSSWAARGITALLSGAPVPSLSPPPLLASPCCLQDCFSLFTPNCLSLLNVLSLRCHHLGLWAEPCPTACRAAPDSLHRTHT